MSDIRDDDERPREAGAPDRLITVGLVAAGIAHELRNPLSVIESSAFILRKLVDGDRALRHVETIATQVKDCNRIMAALLELTKAGPVERTSVRPEDAFASALDHAVVPDDVEVTTAVDEGLVLSANGTLLAQAVANLVTNSVRALAGRAGRVRLAACRTDEGADVSVTDDGPGFPADVLPRAFEPLVTGHLAGTGLGLALVRSIAERHGGRAIAENRPEGGAIVRLSLPAPEGERA